MPDQTWTINYLPPEGGRITGKLTLSTEQVTFTGLYDSSNIEIIKSIADALAQFSITGTHGTYFGDGGEEFTITLERSNVHQAVLHKKRLMKQAVITMIDGAVFTFDYGMLNPKNLVAALNK